MNVAQAILRLFGWTLDPSVAAEAKCVVVVAPHTSNWDLFIGKLGYAALGRKASFLMKKDWFFWPLGPLFRRIGGVPVDRSRHTSLIDQMVQHFASHEAFNLAITPEATRQANKDWKLGFYYIAQEANVPIHIAYIDYRTKHIGVCHRFRPSADIAADIALVKSFYRAEQARYPEQFAV